MRTNGSIFLIIGNRQFAAATHKMTLF